LYGLRHLGAEDRAEDLVQDVLLIALAKLRSGEVRELERIGSFILGTARMRTKSAHRTNRRDRQLDDSFDELPHRPDEPRDPIARDRLARCLEALNDQQQAIVVLTYYGEQSTRDIATSLGLSPNNVRVTRHRGIAQLRDCLGFELGEAA
jgi:RNA polymerase sigma-70 factor (ECF subfamily)